MEVIPGIFEIVKENVTVNEAAELYGLDARRGMCLCPFHDDHHPSMKLNERYFYCFTCHKSGDVIDLAARLTGFTPLDAAKELAHVFRLDITCERPEKPVKKPLTPFHARKVVNEYQRILRRRLKRLSPKSPDEELSEAFSKTVTSFEKSEEIMELLYSNEPCYVYEGVALLEENGLINKLEAFNERFGKEIDD